MSNRNKLFVLAVLTLGAIFIFFFWGMTERNADYLFMIRTPKLFGMIFAGLTIAISSIIFQTITNNRILTPSILGLDAMFVFIQSALVFLFGSLSIFMLNDNLNFMISTGFMIIGALLLFQFLFQRYQSDIMLLLLIGVIFGTLFRSLSTFIQMVLDPNEFQVLQDAMFASFNRMNTDVLWICFAVLLFLFPYLYKKIKYLDVMLLGREAAINLGVPYDRITKQMLILVAVLVSISTALVGPITFLGIIVVNLTYEMFHTYSHKQMLISSSFIAILSLIGGQVLVERIFNFSTPISVIINLVGGIYFIFILLKAGKK